MLSLKTQALAFHHPCVALLLAPMLLSKDGNSSSRLELFSYLHFQGEVTCKMAMMTFFFFSEEILSQELSTRHPFTSY